MLSNNSVALSRSETVNICCNLLNNDVVIDISIDVYFINSYVQGYKAELQKQSISH